MWERLKTWQLTLEKRRRDILESETDHANNPARGASGELADVGKLSVHFNAQRREKNQFYTIF